MVPEKNFLRRDVCLSVRFNLTNISPPLSQGRQILVLVCALGCIYEGSKGLTQLQNLKSQFLQARKSQLYFDFNATNYATCMESTNGTDLQ